MAELLNILWNKYMYVRNALKRAAAEREAERAKREAKIIDFPVQYSQW